MICTNILFIFDFANNNHSIKTMMYIFAQKTDIMP